MPGPDPGIHADRREKAEAWMAGSKAGHDDNSGFLFHIASRAHMGQLGSDPVTPETAALPRWTRAPR